MNGKQKYQINEDLVASGTAHVILSICNDNVLGTNTQNTSRRGNDTNTLHNVSRQLGKGASVFLF